MSGVTDPRPVVDARGGSEGTRIDLDDVCRFFAVGDTVVKALDGVNLHVDDTAFVVVLGASGSGKTTLLNLIGALDTPTEGTIRLAGVELTTASRAERTRIRRGTVSFIFQSFNLFPGLTALENVQFGADVAGRPDAERVATDVLEQVGLGERAQHFAHQLSGGEQQRVAIARALANSPQLILADEPTGNLDEQTGGHIIELLSSLSRDHNTTILVVTHDRSLAHKADRRFRLQQGRLTEEAARTQVAAGSPA